MAFERGGDFFNRVIDWCHSHYPDHQGDEPPPNGAKAIEVEEPPL